MHAESVKPIALFAVKAVHTLIFFSLAWAVLSIFSDGLTNRVSRKTGVAMAAILVESMVFAGNGWRCPLTKLAEALGATNGTVVDIFLPQWFARRIPVVSSTLIGFGLLAMLWHRTHPTTAVDAVVARPTAAQ